MRIVDGRRWLFAVRVTLALLLSFGATSAFATPVTPEIEAKREEARAVQAQIEELAALVELRGEEYAQINVALEQTRVDIAEARRALESAKRQLSDAQARLEGRVDSIYRNGSVHIIQVLLETHSFTDFLTRVEWLRRIGENDAALVVNVQHALDRVVEAEAVLTRRGEEQQVLRAQAASKLAEVEAALDREVAYLAGVNSEIAELVAAEEERLRREAEERARRAAIDAARRAAELAASSAGGGSRRTAIANDRVFDSAALGPGNPAAVQIGMGYLGVPYVWGGSTPAGFDCSGLVQYVFRQIGVSLPRTSRQQFRVGAFIPPDRVDLLLPGDLVFFGFGGDPDLVHHVGIYVGGGDYLHAPRRGQPVRVDSLTSRIERRGDYVGATRP